MLRLPPVRASSGQGSGWLGACREGAAALAPLLPAETWGHGDPVGRGIFILTFPPGRGWTRLFKLN